MGRLGPLTSQGLGRSPYDDVVQGEGVEDPRGHHQLYDERGRPINPETKRINRDVIRSHNEVMMVIGVAEPENGVAEAQIEAARKHHQYEDRIGRRLLLLGGVLETTAIWGVNGMRQRILLYKPYSQTTFYGMFKLAWSQQSLSSYFFGGLPSFLASTILEQLAVPGSRKYPMVQYATTYIRLHLAIYTFFQRTGIIPFRRLLPNWRFFIPGTSISPIPLPPIPTSFRPRSLLQWLGAFALGAAPFAGFYLYTKLYSLITRTLRFKIYRLLPRPYNASGGASSHQSLRGNSDPTQPSPDSEPRPPQHDDFASDDEETEIISATLISFDVEATEPTTPGGGSGGGGGGGDPSSSPASNNNPNGANGDTTPGVWSAELRPNLADGSRPTGNGGFGPHGGGCGGGPEPVYRENVLTRLPAVLATDVLAITPARLLMTPLAAAVWLGLARPYMARLGGGAAALEGVVEGAGRWGGLWSARALGNLLGLELLLAVMHGEAWAVVMLAAERFRFSEEEWNEREGVGREEDEEQQQQQQGI
ncbi:hypothetical protein NEMBOFW57_005246 [Staphylotrichum longicolle]|uniref:Uncharacterized protein n=1 Tax=Staphylotrichum longicolle TaxID=669026 RepID=A0AAD4HZH8_9PEZI|nr:hypothetical protein NEMBOFW57_005246 [Staphylotrichum longicolle]